MAECNEHYLLRATCASQITEGSEKEIINVVTKKKAADYRKL